MNQLASRIDEYILDATKREDPFPMLAELRAQGTGADPTGVGPWLLTTVDAAKAIFLDKRTSRWAAAELELDPYNIDDPEVSRAINACLRMMINLDGAEHFKLRRLVMQAFTPSVLREWRAWITDTAKRLVDGVIDEESFDFRTRIAFPLPEMVICGMLGVPHEDHVKWSQWSADAVAANRAAGASGENLRIAQRATYNFYKYFQDLIAERAGSKSKDLLSLLVNAREAGEQLSEDEVIATMIMLIQAGHETTANLVNSLMYHLLGDPAAMAQLRADPALIPAAVQEAVRLYSPAHFSMPRQVTEDVDVSGSTIPAGSTLMSVWGAVNRDPGVFPNPDAFDCTRPELSRHVAFGIGVHACPGRRLAEMEAEIMMHEVITRLPELELVHQPVIMPSFTRGYDSLEVRRKRAA